MRDQPCAVQGLTRLTAFYIDVMIPRISIIGIAIALAQPSSAGEHWSLKPPRSAVPDRVHVDSQSDRCVRPGKAAKSRPQTGAGGRPGDADRRNDLRSDRPAADARGSWRILCWEAIGKTARAVWEKWSIGCWPVRITANAGAGIGSMSFATPSRRASSTTAFAPAPGVTAITSSRRSTTTSRSTVSSLEQMAGDESRRAEPSKRPEDHDCLVAAGFHRLGPVRRNAGNKLVAFSRNEVLTEMTDAIGAVFLGLTMGCARCHDHRFDDITPKGLLSAASVPRLGPGTRSGARRRQGASRVESTHRRDSRPDQAAAEADRQGSGRQGRSRRRSPSCSAVAGAAADDQHGQERRQGAHADLRSQARRRREEERAWSVRGR